MLVFHLATDNAGHPVLWAEDSTRPPQQPPKPGRPPVLPDPREHPFAATIETLQTAIDEFSFPVSSDDCEQTTLIACCTTTRLTQTYRTVVTSDRISQFF